jgi:GH35 family endo-1,4-beta-xylanase
MDQIVNEDDPYCRSDPGVGLQRVSVYKFDLENNFNAWKSWRTNDGRVLTNSNSSFTVIENPFDFGYLLLLNTCFNPATTGRSFGGFGMRAPINTALSVDNKTFIEFELYYPVSAANKYMRFEIWSTSTGGEGSQANAGSPGTNRSSIYIRTTDLDGVYSFNLNKRCGYYNNETWFKKSVHALVPVTTGSWEYLNIDLHTETNAKVDNGLLMIGNIRITQPDPDRVPIPDVVNTKQFSEVDPVKKKYNPDNGYFLMGTIGTGTVAPDSIRGYHYGIFVDENNLKPERHLGPPQWLRAEYPHFVFNTDNEESEWDLPTSNYSDIRDSGKPDEYELHGHTLSWCNQSPPWMRQIVPESITSMEWNKNGLFYSSGIKAAGPFQRVKKETARRVYFNHILYVMRHFMSTDTRYDSGEKRGIIPFHSFDVVNVEIHESRHNAIIQNNQNVWKTGLRNVSWLMAMTDNDFDDIRQHYIYLLFKYAHIAVPNAQMAEKYKAGFNDPNIVPEYMKMDNHDDNGSIDAFVSAKPPILICNDYDFTVRSKTIVACNMIKEINAAWKTDPLYDGRNLIECIGIQGHEMVSPDLVSQYRHAFALFAAIIDEGLLDWICISELDMKQSDTAPGGGARAPDILNQKQADAIGYQYALLFKVFEKFKEYIDHVIFWSQFGASWLSSYVLFDHEQMASQAYYAVMDPDKFISGHSYLDSYFTGEHVKNKK